MTDNEIIKALECFAINKDFDYCQCIGCAFENQSICSENASEGIAKISLNLINRQKAEIERLNIELQSMRSAANSYKMHYEKAQTDIEKLTLEIEEANEADRESAIQVLKESKENAKLFCEAINYIKSEAIKEFAERLKENYCFTDRWGKIITKSTVDNLVKEMTEGKNG